MMDKIKVLLADDNDVIRGVIRRFLEEQPEITLVGEARGFAQTVYMTNELKPQIILLDLHMKDEAGPELALIKSQLNRCESKIVAISIANDQEAKALAESFGAVTLLDKANLVDDLIPTIMRCVLASINSHSL
jgi:response regulator of citrate/malate metabolism